MGRTKFSIFKYRGAKETKNRLILKRNNDTGSVFHLGVIIVSLPFTIKVIEIAARVPDNKGFVQLRNLTGASFSPSPFFFFFFYRFIKQNEETSRRV